MQPSHRKSIRKQTGSVVLNAAIALSLLVIVLVGIELGYLFFLKRELQKTADLAALAGAQALGAGDCDAARRAAAINGNLNLPARLLDMSESEATCGNWDSNRPPPRHFGAPVAGQKLNAILVTLTRTPALLLPMIPGNAERSITVEAIAAQQQPVAILNIRSTLLTVNSDDSALLNLVIGGLLGGSLNLNFASWQGLINTDIQLLQYLDVLAINLGVSAGNYDQLLQTNVSAQQLLQAAITVLERQVGSTPGDALSLALAALDTIKGQINLSPITPMKVGELLGIQSGTAAAGLEATLQVFKLVEGVVQLANSHSAVAASIPITLPGLGSISVKTKVIEPPQISSAGNPALAQLNPTGPDQIFVRTAQVRTLISIELGGLTNIVNDLLNVVFAQLAPITSFVNDVLHLNLIRAVGNFLGGLICPLLSSCPASEAIYAKIAPTARLDIGIEAASGQAHVHAYTCNSNGNKTLTVPVKTAAVTLRIGTWGTDAEEAQSTFFSSKLLPQVEPISLIEIGKQTVRPDFCLLTLCKDLKWKKGSTWVENRDLADFTLEAALGIRADTNVAGASEDLIYSTPEPEDLPEITQQPAYQKTSSHDIVGSLSSTLSNIEIKPYKSASSGILGNLLFGTVSLLNGVIDQLTTIIRGLLSPLIDPLLDFLLQALGVNVAVSEVGARLTCKNGAELVY